MIPYEAFDKVWAQFPNLEAIEMFIDTYWEQEKVEAQQVLAEMKSANAKKEALSALDFI